MYKYLFKAPIELNKRKANAILTRMFEKFNIGLTASQGELLTRIGIAIQDFFAGIRRSRISESIKVSRNEGPSSKKMNQLFDQMAGDMSDTFAQQNAIDQSIVEVHNFIDTRKESIRNDLQRASQTLKELISLVGSDKSVIIFEDSFNTLDKVDTEFVTALPMADVDRSAGIVTLHGEKQELPLSKIISKDVQIAFDGVPIYLGHGNIDNSYSDGKLYGDPTDLGENGIRIGRESIARILGLVELKKGGQRGSDVFVGGKPPGGTPGSTDKEQQTQQSPPTDCDTTGKAGRRGSLNPDGTVSTTEKCRIRDNTADIINSKFPNPFN